MVSVTIRASAARIIGPPGARTRMEESTVFEPIAWSFSHSPNAAVQARRAAKDRVLAARSRCPPSPATLVRGAVARSRTREARFRVCFRVPYRSSRERGHSIIWSARTSIDGGILRPSALAVLVLTTSSTRVGS